VVILSIKIGILEWGIHVLTLQVRG
jgi:hypothetical protein